MEHRSRCLACRAGCGTCHAPPVYQQECTYLLNHLTQAEVLVVHAHIVGHVRAGRGLGRHAAGPLARASALIGADVDLAAKADMAALGGWVGGCVGMGD